jgi:hypothetical protein
VHGIIPSIIDRGTDRSRTETDKGISESRRRARQGDTEFGISDEETAERIANALEEIASKLGDIASRLTYVTGLTDDFLSVKIVKSEE